jgi:DNA-binding transcriptional MerR regulator
MQELVAFTADHVARLTGLSKRQLGYWDKTEFFAPTLIDEFQRRAFGRIYSFRDVVGLRTIAILRNQHKIALQELRRVGAWLQREHETRSGSSPATGTSSTTLGSSRGHVSPQRRSGISTRLGTTPRQSFASILA